MGNRLPVVVSFVVAAVALGVSQASAAPAADECIAKPKGVAPAGKHWYYRTNREIKRKCWYLGDEGAPTTAEVAPPKKQAAAVPVEPEPKASEPPAVNARAELIEEPRFQQPQLQQPAAPAAQPQSGALQSDTGQSDTAQNAPEDTSSRNWAVASRWADQNAFSSDPATVGSVSAPTARSEKPAPQAEEPSAVIAAEPAEPVAASFDITGALSLGQLIAALILAVIVAGTVFMAFASRRRRVVTEEMPVHQMPWAGAAAAPKADETPQSRLGEEIEELDRLLTIAREARANEVALAGDRTMRWRPAAS